MKLLSDMTETLVSMGHEVTVLTGFPNWPGDGKPLTIHFTPGERFSYSGSGMVFLDGTVVNIAIPVMGRDLHAGISGVQWVLDAYLVVLSALDNLWKGTSSQAVQNLNVMFGLPENEGLL